MKAAVVIGANYGDEGKGLVTDYIAASSSANTIVVRFNGGAQAGHTVERPNGLRHVFSHFSSGTLAGAHTYLSQFFIANPILFNQELEKLRKHGYSPKVIIHPKANVTTLYDMFINQTFENFMGDKRHGSCGVGINETIERNLHEKFRLTVNDLFNHRKLVERLLNIRSEWVERRLKQLMQRRLTKDEKTIIFSDDMFEYFLKDIQIFLNYCDVSEYHLDSNHHQLIFEGAQGLLLDQNHQGFPHVTRSNTGIQNVSAIASDNKISHLDIYYVTRCYLTRHGAGPLANEYPACPFPHFKDETNVSHAFQGMLRFAPINIEKMNAEIIADLNKLSKIISRKTTFVVTCLDHVDEKIAVSDENKHIIELEKNDFQKYIFDKTKFDNYIFSDGPTREHCKVVRNDKVYSGCNDRVSV